MNYEKAYKEALETARKINNGDGVAAPADWTVCETIFPVLREDYDDMIRGAIIDHLKDNNLTEWADWLEKQGQTFIKKDVDDAYLKGICDAKQELEKQCKQKPVSKVKPKFRIGDVIEVKPMKCQDKIFTGKTNKIIDITEESYIFDDGKAYNIELQDGWKISEQKLAWCEEEEKIKKAISDILLIDNDEIREILDSNNVLMQDIDTWLEKQEGKKTITIPRFSIGDEIKNGNEESLTITKIDEKGYWSGDLFICNFDESVAWTLVGKVCQPKFQEGEWITNGDYTWKIVEVKPLDYILQSQDGNIVDDTISHVDEQFHSFTIEDAKPGDVLFIEIDASTCIFKKFEENLLYSYIISDGKLLIEDSHYYYETSDNVHPAPKEQRDLLFQKMKEDGYEWSDKDRKLIKIVE